MSGRPPTFPEVCYWMFEASQGAILPDRVADLTPRQVQLIGTKGKAPHKADARSMTAAQYRKWAVQHKRRVREAREKGEL